MAEKKLVMGDNGSLDSKHYKYNRIVSSAYELSTSYWAYILTLIITIGVVGIIFLLTSTTDELIEFPDQTFLYLGIGIVLVWYSYSESKQREDFEEVRKYKKLIGSFILLTGNAFIALAMIGLFGII